jgi:protein CpxP
MNESKALKILKWAVVLLMLCNVGLMLTLWFKPANSDGGHRGETPRDFVIRNLHFSDAQIAEYDVLISAHQDAMHRLRREAMDYRQQLFGNLRNTGQDSLLTDSLAQLIAFSQKQMEVVTYLHFRQVRTICTAVQQPEFDRIIGDVIKKMNGHRGGPPPHDHEGPPHDHREGEHAPPGDRPGPPPGEDGPPPGRHS